MRKAALVGFAFGMLVSGAAVWWLRGPGASDDAAAPAAKTEAPRIERAAVTASWTPTARAGVANEARAPLPSGELSSATPQPRHSRASTRSLESSLIANGALDTVRVDALTEGDRFAGFLAELERQNATDLEARELKAVYARSISQALAGSGTALETQAISCGLQLCGIDLTGPADNKDLFLPLLNMGKDSGARVYTALTAIVPNADGSFSYRMVFTTDPAMNYFIVPPVDPAKPPG